MRLGLAMMLAKARGSIIGGGSQVSGQSFRCHDFYDRLIEGIEKREERILRMGRKQGELR